MTATEIATQTIGFYINGKWEDRPNRPLMPVTNPATGDVIAQVACADAADVDRAVQAAHAAFLRWRDVPVVDRVQAFYRYKALLDANHNELARVLTREILAKGSTNAALVAYEAERRPATSDLVMLNRRNGPEQVMQLVEERAPDGYNVVTDVLLLKELEDIAANYKRVAGFQVEGLNAKPPIVQLPLSKVSSGR